MRITYTGRKVELAPAQLKKLEAAFGKVGKLLDGKEEREAHVVISLERHLHRAEISVNYHGHDLVGEGADTDLFTSIHSAAAKLEKQAIKVRDKWRDTKRTPRKESQPEAPDAAPLVEDAQERRVFHIDHHKKRKPMTLDEALIEMEKDRDYLVFRDSETDHVNVLVRRRDGHYDLVIA